MCSDFTPNVKVERFELRNVIRPSARSENRSEKNTKYNDIDVIKMAWALDIPLQKWFKLKLKSRGRCMQVYDISPVVPFNPLDLCKGGKALEVNRTYQLGRIISLRKNTRV